MRKDELRIGFVGSREWGALKEPQRELFRKLVVHTHQKAVSKDLTPVCVTGGAEGCDELSAELMLELGGHVHLIRPWPNHRADWVASLVRRYPQRVRQTVYSRNLHPDWYTSVLRWHPFYSVRPEKLTSQQEALHARNYGIVEFSQAMVALPKSAPDGGGTGQAIRIALAIGRPLYNLSLEEGRKIVLEREVVEYGCRRAREITASVQYQLDPELPMMEFWTDGSADAATRCGGVGIVAVHPGGKKEWALPLLDTTSNAAELTAVVESLKRVKNPGSWHVRVYTDSANVIGWCTQGYRCSFAHLQLLIAEVKELARQCARFDLVKVKGHADSENNCRADDLASQALQAAREVYQDETPE